MFFKSRRIALPLPQSWKEQLSKTGQKTNPSIEGSREPTDRGTLLFTPIGGPIYVGVLLEIRNDTKKLA